MSSVSAFKLVLLSLIVMIGLQLLTKRLRLPPDAVAAKAVLERLALPRKLMATLEGESLLNDAAGLVLVRFRLGGGASLGWYNCAKLLVPSHHMSETNWLSEPSTASKRIIFARHGEYPCNVRGVCNSNPRTGFYLTEKGEAQARALGERLKDEKIELIVTSEFLRARQTAWLANKVLNVPQVVNRLANENRVGAEFEGRPGDDFQRFIAHAPATTATADGEPFTGMLARVQSLIADLKLSSPQTVLVVTHGWTLQAVRVILNEISPDDAARCVDMPSNCEIIEGRF